MVQSSSAIDWTINDEIQTINEIGDIGTRSLYLSFVFRLIINIIIMLRWLVNIYCSLIMFVIEEKTFFELCYEGKI